jgi:hypothetical protein
MSEVEFSAIKVHRSIMYVSSEMATGLSTNTIVTRELRRGREKRKRELRRGREKRKRELRREGN